MTPRQPTAPPAELVELVQNPDADWDRDGFHPTMRRPFPSMQCTGVVRNGDRAGLRCERRAYYGSSVCWVHGAQLPVVREKADRIVESAQLLLRGHAEDAAMWLLDLGANSSSDAVRLKAATEVLDRAGVRGGVDINISGEITDPAELLRERLRDLREKTILDVTATSVVEEHDYSAPSDTVALEAAAANTSPED
jgi:hypothetical protein